MTAATSNKKPNYFGKRFLQGLNGCKMITVINCILHILGLPLICAVSLIIYKNFDLPEKQFIKLCVTCEPFLYLGYITLCAAMLTAVVYALFQFSYLYRREIVDMHYSLPLSNNQRFFADYLSGLAGYLLPALVSAAVSAIIVFIGAKLIPATADDNFIKMVYASIPIGIIAMIQFYTLCVLAVSFCGSLFESIFSVVGIIVTIPSTVIAVLANIISSNDFGLDNDVFLTSNFFTSTNPIGAVIYWGYMVSDIGGTINNDFLIASFVRWSVAAAVTTVVFLLGAWLLYSRRKAEDVSKPYVFSSCYYVIMGLITFAVLTLFRQMNANMIAGIIVTAVVWLVMEVIRRRGFRKIWTFSVSFGVSLIVIFGSFHLFNLSDGFKLYRMIPDASEVKTLSYTYNPFTDYKFISFDDRNVIEEAVKLNNKILEINNDPDSFFTEQVDRNELDSFVQSIANIKLVYHTRDGRKISREYIIPTDLITDFEKAVLNTDAFADSHSERFKYEYNETTDSYELNVSAPFSESQDTRSLDEKDVEYLMNAYNSDMKQLTVDKLRTERVIGFINNEMILEGFDNTLAALEELKISIPEFTLPVIRDSAPSKLPVRRDPKIVSPFIFGHFSSIFSSDFNFEDAALRPSLTGFNTEFYDHGNPTEYIDLDNEAAGLLLRNTTCAVIGEKPIAVIYLYNKTYFVLNTDENRELLEKCVKQYTDEELNALDDHPLNATVAID